MDIRDELSELKITIREAERIKMKLEILQVIQEWLDLDGNNKIQNDLYKMILAIK